MDIRQLTYFVSTYEHNSFSAAAKECCVTVQTISKAISNLENSFDNEPLFIRKNNGVVPTVFGRAFYPKAIDALCAFNDAVQFASGYRKQKDEKNTLFNYLCVPQFPNSETVCSNIDNLLGFAAKDVKVSTRISSFSEGVMALDTLEADMLITIGDPEIDCYDKVRVGSIPTAVIMAKTSPLALSEYVTKQDLETYPIIRADDFDAPYTGSIVNMYLEKGFKLSLITPNSSFEFGLISFRDNGMCLVVSIPAVVPSGIDLVMRQIDPADMVSVSICLVTRKGEKPAGYDEIKKFLLGGGLIKGFTAFKKSL